MKTGIRRLALGMIAAFAVATPTTAMAATSMPEFSSAPPAVVRTEASVQVEQGQKIFSASGGTCSITVIDSSTAYTAQHCGDGKWTVGSNVMDLGRHVIGTVAYIPPQKGMDYIKIKLSDGVRIDKTWTKRATSTLVPGEPLYVRGLGERTQVGHLVDLTHQWWIGTNDQTLYITPHITRAGMSGGAVLDMQGNVVGINVGYSGGNTVFMPWDRMQ
ncbi:S1-C subfamily serine protease [Arcanobacterium pluranimalium]|uniref:trypsin-like peptidase domain-containing protein n=1 Tax=Arcanobacterium pluranimalium TaxID=108028 RepID=UPI001958774D|nr:trypsin-like peptidase domain-containing protein [Arcanobacterium pluranimalium]MBM7825779.1 S1-C subfamily serine protease [Arcanobacterium pluranimalium]